MLSQQSVHKVQKKYDVFCIIWRVISHSKKGISHHFQNFSQNVNFYGWNKCHKIVSRKISIFSKMQRGRSPPFELLQLDMYAVDEHSNRGIWNPFAKSLAVGNMGWMTCRNVSTNYNIIVPVRPSHIMQFLTTSTKSYSTVWIQCTSPVRRRRWKWLKAL